MGKRKKPKDLDDFWNKYVQEISPIKKDIKEIKKNKWIKWLSPIITAIGIIVAFSIGAGLITSEKLPNIIAQDMIERVTNSTNQAYKIEIFNAGNKFASNVEVRIVFPFQNTTIYKVYVNGEKLTQKDGIGGYEYSYTFPKVRMYEKVYIIVLIENDDFVEGGDEIVMPTTYLWSDEEGPTSITTVDENIFI